MPNILLVAYSVEGNTDERFLQNVIQRTFDEIANLCNGEITVFPVEFIPNQRKDVFSKNVCSVAQHAYEMGINVLCIHTDADADNDIDKMNFKINPAFEAVRTNADPNVCKNLVAIVPVRMTEAWMLADRDVLKDEINTDKSDADLGIARDPETIADPKAVIEAAIRISLHDKPRKSRNIAISDLYQPLGQKIPLENLARLPSYLKFRRNVEQAFRILNYLE